MCSLYLDRTKYKVTKVGEVSIKHKNEDIDIRELDKLTKLLSVVLETLSPNDLSTRIVSKMEKKLIFDKLTGLTEQLNFKIPDINATNIMDEESCVDCHTSFEKIGNSFLTMFNNTLVSELPFDEESNRLVLNCSYCRDDVPLKILSAKVLHDLRTGGGMRINVA